MPTYVFKCEKCGNSIEQMMSLKEYTENPFPMCVEDGCDGNSKMKVQLQPTAFALKGTGWTPKFDGTERGPSTDLMKSNKYTKKKG
jgi:predicted nucleic acid-binding Zn ribbon protein